MSNPEGYRGYDFDGVLSPYQGNGPITPIEPFVIITGNSLANWEVVKNGPQGTKWPIYMNPGDLSMTVEDIGNWKAKMVKELNLIEFYDDNGLICLIVKTQNPTVAVYRVVGQKLVEQPHSTWNPEK